MPAVAASHTTRAERIDKAVGCLVLGAVGDALGATVEFSSERTIRARYGPAGIQVPDRGYGVLGPITDDTQMTLVAADSLTAAYRRGAERGILGPWWTYSAMGYRRWLDTQRQGVRSDAPSWWGSPKLFEVLQEQGPRAPGNTCVRALGAMPHPPVSAVNDRKGCGTVMRVAPVGLFFGNLAETLDEAAERRIYDEGVADAAITHGHPTAQHASGMSAVIIAQLLHGADLPGASSSVLEQFGTPDLQPLCRSALKRVAQERISVSGLGEGWIAEEALAIGLYAALWARLAACRWRMRCGWP